MSFSVSRGSFRAALLAGASVVVLQPIAAMAQTSESRAESIIVEGERSPDYKVAEPSIGKLTEPLVDTPQSITTVSQQLMQDRVVTNLNDAFRNIPTITLGAGEFKSLGTSPTIRGFVARTDMFIDGQRDIGDYYRDTFDFEQVQVLEGPASTLFGRGSTGGVINQVTKKPQLAGFVSGGLTVGTDLTRRVTVDVNEELPELGPGAAFRIVAMGHEANVTGRDVVEQNRYGFAPSLSLGLGTPTRLTLAYLHESADDVPDYGIPYLGTQVVAVPRQNFYGFKSDYMKTDADIVTLTAEHDFAEGVTLSNKLRYAAYSQNFRFTEPLIAATVPVTTPLSAVTVTRNDNTGINTQSMLWDQLDAIAHFDTGAVKHTVAAGIEGGHEIAKPEFDNSTGVPTVPLLSPNPDTPFTATSTFPRFKTNTDANSFTAYVMDTLKFSPQWELTGGVRWDYFGMVYRDQNFSTTTPGLVTRTDTIPQVNRVFSYRGALVYKPDTNASIYFAYGTSFNPSGEELSFVASSRSFNIGNAALAPEKNSNLELGGKWDALDGHLSLTAALFRAEKDNARVPDPTNSALNVLAGDFRVDGLELNAVGHLTDAWQIQAGYAYLDSSVIKSAAGAAPVGSPLMNTPKHTVTAWTSYNFGGGWEAGGGGRYVSSQYTQNVPPIKSVPGFFEADAMARYIFSQKLSVQLNVNNIFDKYYYDQLHFFHVVPAEGRTALLTVNLDY